MVELGVEGEDLVDLGFVLLLEGFDELVQEDGALGHGFG